ncbi:MAG: CHAT domain-containing protein [Bacteroidia bacterium]
MPQYRHRQAQQGEGVFTGLAHAFTYAGCPNVIMSLWQVNDHSTAELMQYFYQALNEEKPDDVALREAKLAFLESADPLKASPLIFKGLKSIGDSGRPFGGLPGRWLCG